MPRIRYEGLYFKIWLDRQLVLTVAMFFPPSTLSLCVEPFSNGNSCLRRCDEATFDSSGVYRNTKLRFLFDLPDSDMHSGVNSREVVIEGGDDAVLLVQWRHRYRELPYRGKAN